MGKDAAVTAATLVAWDIYMTWNIAEGDCFSSVGKISIVFDYFLHVVLLQNPLRGSKPDIKSEKIMNLGVCCNERNP